MIRNSSNLTSAGSEIITNLSSQRSLLFSAGKASRKLITKSYKITNETSIPDSLNNINNNISQINNNNNSNQTESIIKTPIQNIKTKSDINNNNNEQSGEIKDKTTLDLSNIQYKDSYTLKDAPNSNPGYCLWPIRFPLKDKIIQKKNILSVENKKEETKNNNLNKKYNFHDTDLNYKYTKYINNEEIIENNIINKKIIDKLTNKLNDLEKKYMTALSNYQEKKYLSKNAIKIKNEYDQLFKENTEEIKIIKEQSDEFNSQNKVLENALSNARNEINRLLNIMKEDKKNMNKLRNEFNNRQKKEEMEREKLNNIIKSNESKIEILNEKNNELEENNSEKFGLFGSNTFDIDLDNEQKKDYQIKKLKEIVLNLQIKIRNLKNNMNSNKEEMNKLNNILKYKNMKEEYQRININNLFYTVEENEYNSQINNIILKNKDEIIRKLNENILSQHKGIKRNIKKIPKSSSQELIWDNKRYDL